MLTLLTILAAGYSNTMRTETKLTANLVQSAQAKALAEAGIWQSISELLRPTNDQIWIADGSTYTYEFNSHTINVRLFDESGKIDLNTATPELILGLFESIDTLSYDEAAALSDAIQDWRDKDSLTRLNGAEDEDYERLGYNYGAKDGPFNTLNELQQIIGMTPTLYNKIRPAVTIYSGKSSVNKLVAPYEVLRALPGETDESANDFIESRSFNFESDSLIGSALKNRSSTAGKTFTIYSEGVVRNTKAHISAVILLKQNNKRPYSILSWQEDQVIEAPEDKRDDKKELLEDDS